MTRSRIASIILLAALGLPAAATGAESFSSNYWSPYPAPRRLHQAEDGHWTPYQPPATPPANAETYVIESGDTMWDLAAQFMGDNLLWPVLAEMNPYITDPHWIYPGDPLFVTRVQVMPQGELKKQKPYVLPELAQDFRPTLSIPEANCFHFITDDWTRWDTILVSGEQPMQSYLANDDVVYIDRGSADGVQPGDEYAVLGFESLLRHPRTFKEMGQVIQVVAKARILCTREHESTAILTGACREVMIGARLRPWKSVMPPLAPRDARIQRYCQDRSDLARGQIVFVSDGRTFAASRHMVSLDVGAVDGLLPGDRMTIFRESLDDRDLPEVEVYGGREPKRKVAPRFYSDEVMENAFAGDFDKKNRYNRRAVYGEMDWVRRVIGEVTILVTEPHTSTGVVTTSFQELAVGDSVEYRVEENVPGTPLTAETYTVSAPAPPPPAAQPAPDQEGLRYKLKQEGGPRKKRVVPEK